MTATLAAVTGAPAWEKTALAHSLAQQLGRPAIIRDEIKQGMVVATVGYRPAVPTRSTPPTLEALFQVLKVLLQAGITVVAEAAHQDRLRGGTPTRALRSQQR